MLHSLKSSEGCQCLRFTILQNQNISGDRTQRSCLHLCCVALEFAQFLTVCWYHMDDDTHSISEVEIKGKNNRKNCKEYLKHWDLGMKRDVRVGTAYGSESSSESHILVRLLGHLIVTPRNHTYAFCFPRILYRFWKAYKRRCSFLKKQLHMRNHMDSLKCKQTE